MEFSPIKRHLPPVEAKKSKRAKWYTVKIQYSPDKEDDEESQEPVLLLKQFSSFPHVSFDKVAIGKSKTCCLLIQNPLDVPQQVFVEKCPFKKGFSVSNLEFVVDPESQYKLEIMWMPTEVLSCREVVMFRTSAGCRTQAYVLGNAFSPPKKKKSQTSKYPVRRNTFHGKKTFPPTEIYHAIPASLNDDKENTAPATDSSGMFFSSEIKSSLTSVPAIFALKQDDSQFSESPIRRQTYLINEMFDEAKLESSKHLQNTTDILCTQGSPVALLPKRTTFITEHNGSAISPLNLPQISPRKEIASSTNGNSPEELKNIFTTCTSYEILSQESPTDSLNSRSSSDSMTCRHSDEASPKYSPKSDISMYIEAKKREIDTEKGLIFCSTSMELTVDAVSPKESKPSEFITCIENIQTCFPDMFSEAQTCSHEESVLIHSAPDIDRSLQSVKSLGNKIESTPIPVLNINSMETAICEEGDRDKLNNEGQRNIIPDMNIIHCEEQSPSILCGTMAEASPSVELDDVQRCSTGILLSVPDMTIPSQFLDSVNEYLSQNSDESEKVVCKNASRKGRASLNVNATSISKSVADRDKINEQNTMRRRCQSVGGNKLLVPETHEDTMKRKSPKSFIFKSPTVPKKKKKIIASKLEGMKLTPAIDDRDKTCNLTKKTPVYRTKSLKVVPRKLNLIKPPVDTARHPNIFAAKNMYYDERWMEKQETAFTRWLNFVLTPPEELKTVDQDVKVNAAKLWTESLKGNTLVRAPTREDMSLRIYTAIRMMNQLRYASCKLYQSEKVRSVIISLEKEIEHKRLLVRKDRQMHADVGIKQHLLQLLMSYNPLWLRIGLETVYGEYIQMQSNQDIHSLSRFIIKRLLNNPDIAAKYSHPTVPHSFRTGYEEEMKKFTLKKFLLLVYHLDIAKTKRLINHDPCLFCKNSEYKASRDLLLVFSREYLSGEGDVTRHLKQLGYVVTHQQTPLDEFDYSVTNIAVDLRCGLRLVRVMELLLHVWILSSTLRIPAISRMQKIHNNEVAMKCFVDAGYQIDGDISARDLVNGHREKTLEFLWQIIFKTQIAKLLDTKILRREIAFLKRNLRLKAEVAAFDALRLPDKVPGSYEIEFECNKQYAENECIQLLFQWCQVVCMHYGLKISNFTVSFSDGRALCYLLHHYFPHVLPLDAIKQETSINYFSDLEKFESENSEDLDNPFKTSSNFIDMELLLKNERENLKLVFEKLQDIGGVPIVSVPTDMSNTIPDEKVIMTLVSYINIRLLDLSQEIRAARLIQLAWRNKNLNERKKQLQVEIEAVIVIQRAVRKFLERRRLQKMRRASLVIQCYWRMYKAKEKLAALRYQRHMKYLGSKAVIIQAVFRGYSVRQKLKKMNTAAVVIQRNVRCWNAKSKYLFLKKTVTLLQQRYRANKLCIEQRQKYLSMKEAVILLQAHTRCWLAVRAFKKQKSAIVTLQSAFRMALCQRRYLRSRNAIIKIQQRYTGKLLTRKCQIQFQKLLFFTIKIQRLYQSRKLKKLETAAAIVIQSHFRKMLVQRTYSKVQRTVVFIQRKWQAKLLGRKEREHFLMMKSRIICLQSHVRKFIAQKHFREAKRAVIIIQKNVRKAIAVRNFNRKKCAAKLIQVWWRSYLLGKKERSNYLKLRNAVIQVQSFYRMIRQKRRLFHLKKAVRTIEIRWQARQCGAEQRNKYLITRQHVMKIQAVFRGYMCRKKMENLKHAAIVIQAFVRCYIARKAYIHKKTCAITIQRYYKLFKEARKQRQMYLKLKTGMIQLQAHYRGAKTRQMIKKQNVCATRIQALYKGRKCRQQYLHLRKMTVILQQRSRAYFSMKQQRTSYLHMKKSSVIIQSAFRGHIERQKYSKIKAAVVKIQSFVRMIICLKRYAKVLDSVILLQQRYRDLQLARLQRHTYLKLRKSCIVLQSHYRGQIARRYVKEVRAAIVIQSSYKMYTMRKQYLIKKNASVKLQSAVRMFLTRSSYKSQRKAAITIQRHFRQKRIAVSRRNEFLKIKRACITIQSYYRGHLARTVVKQIKAAIIIQAYFRMFVEKRKFKTLKTATIKIQSCVRRAIACKNYRTLQNAVQLIQKRYRETCVAKSQRKEFLQMKQACIVLQSYIRCLIARRSYLNTRRSIILVQSYVRMKIERKKFQQRYCAVVKLQSYFHSTYLRNKARKDFLQKRNAAIKIEAWYRCMKIRSNYLTQRKQIIFMQAIFRGYLVRKEYAKQIQAVIKIQRTWRRILRVRKEQRRREAAAICIQRRYRAYRERCKYVKLLNVVTLLQAHVRRQLARQHVARLKLAFKAALVIQTHYRACVARKHLKMLKQRREKALERIAEVINFNLQAIRIQRYFRKFQLRKRANELLQAVVVIQRWVRSMQLRFWFLKLRRSIRIFQLAARVHLQKKLRSAVCIQSYVRSWLVRQHLIKQHKAATKIQALWRAHKVCHSIENKNILLARERIKIATDAATEEQTLGYRTSMALDYLLQYRSMYQLLTALTNLDVATRLSPKCCERVACSGGVDVIIQLIKACNRSVPHMEAIRHSANILLNISKYEKTVDSIWETRESVEVTIELMRIFREKGSSIFTKCCSLLWILSQDSCKAQVIKDSPISKQIASLHYLVMRKKKIEDKRLLCKRKTEPIAPSFLHSTLAPKPKKSLQIQPDWILGNQVMREFDDPVVAICAVMKTLNLIEK